MGPPYWTVIENLWEAIGELGIRKILVGQKDKEKSLQVKQSTFYLNI